ncbi:MAG TPA: ABC transporter substrate-binding protein [Acetobacteraceae bacterium]|nr:ABC transporter substrate-binding protein [Acetobacteraceae bacterium]
MTETDRTPGRRTVVKGIGAALAAPLAAPFISPARAAGSEPIRFAIVAAQTGQAAIADHHDYINGAQMAVEEINAAGGVKGREIKIELHDIDLLTPEGTQAAFRAVADSKPHAIGCAFTLIRVPALEALGDYKAPYLSGDTNFDLITYARKHRAKYWNYFEVDPPEIYYGRMFPKFLEQLAAGGVWKPTNDKVHIIREQSNYNMVIAQEVVKTLPSSKFVLGKITDIQFPVQDWGPVMQAIKAEGCGTIMLDYWVGAEEAAFCQQFVADPVKGALVYIQYGPSQPEFLNIAGSAANGFVWSTVLGVYDDAQGAAFRKKYAAKHPGVIGLCYNGSAYDTTYILRNAWMNADPSDFKAVCDYIRTHTYRGVDGAVSLDNEYQAALHYPLQTTDLNKGMAQLYFQVQDGAHKIIEPEVLAQSKFRPFPWA